MNQQLAQLVAGHLSSAKETRLATFRQTRSATASSRRVPALTRVEHKVNSTTYFWQEVSTQTTSSPTLPSVTSHSLSTESQTSSWTTPTLHLHSSRRKADRQRQGHGRRVVRLITRNAPVQKAILVLSFRASGSPVAPILSTGTRMHSCITNSHTRRSRCLVRSSLCQRSQSAYHWCLTSHRARPSLDVRPSALGQPSSVSTFRGNQTHS